MAFIRRGKVVAGFALLILLTTVLWAESSRVRGKLAAEKDLRNGKLVILGFGLPARSQPQYVRILRERYAIEYRAVAGCVVSQSLVSYVEGYDSISSEAIKEKFKHDVLAEAAGEAEREWTREHTAALTPRDIPKSIFPNAPAKKDVACFRSLPRPISMYEVASRCGLPDEEVGSGVYIFIYHLDDGSTVTIGTPYLNKVGEIHISNRTQKN